MACIGTRSEQTRHDWRGWWCGRCFFVLRSVTRSGTQARDSCAWSLVILTNDSVSEKLDLLVRGMCMRVVHVIYDKFDTLYATVPVPP